MQKFSSKSVRSVKFSFTTLSLLVLLAVTCVAAVAEAQTTTTATTTPRADNPDELVEPTSQPATTTSPIASTASASDITALSARQQERIRNLAANQSNQYDAAAARLANIIDRLRQRLALLNETGVDTVAAEAAVVVAENFLIAATGNLATIDAAVATVASGPNPKTAWPAVREQYLAIDVDLRTSKTELERAISLISSTDPNQEQATSTTATPRE